MRQVIPLCAGLLLGGPVLSQEPDQPATLSDVLDAGAQILFLGEVHDNPAHHALQAEIVAEVQPTAIVFEMLDGAAAETVMSERRAGRGDDLADTLNWAARGWPDFYLYYQIIEAAPEAAILGAEIPSRQARIAFDEGAAAVFGQDAPLFGLWEALPEAEQATREEMQFANHCDAIPRDLLPGFVEAQRLRDARLAFVAMGAFEAYGGPVVVITGNGHARRDWGAPALLERARPDLQLYALGQFEAPPGPDIPYDGWSLAVPVDRSDPCDAFP